MNKTTQKYFINLFKRKKRILALYTFIVFMAYPFLLLTDVITNNADGIEYLTVSVFELCLVSLGILSIVLPLFTFRFAFSKKNVDTYYAIPITRNNLFKAHFIAPILGTILPILASYLVGGCFLIASGGLGIYLELLVVLLLGFVMFVIIYSVNTFIILKCNNIIDGSIMTGAIGIVPLLLYSAMYTFLQSQIVRSGMLDSMISKIPDLIIDLFCSYRGLFLVGELVRFSNNNLKISFESFDLVLFIYYVVIGIIFIVQSYRSFKNKKGEDAEQLTTHYLTYPLLSNIALIALILNFNFTEYEITTSLIIVIGLFVVYLIINGIANRSFKITSKMIIKYIVLILVVNGFNFISKETEFFGINRKVLDYKRYDKVVFELNYYDNKDDLHIIYLPIETDNIDIKEKELFDYVEEIQKEKSIAFKEDDYDTLYPSSKEDFIYNLNIQYYLDNNENREEYIFYQLSKDNYDSIYEIMKEIKGISINVE